MNVDTATGKANPGGNQKPALSSSFLTEKIAVLIADELTVKTGHCLVQRIASRTGQMSTGRCFEMGLRDYHYMLDVFNLASQ